MIPKKVQDFLAGFEPKWEIGRASCRERV